MYLDKEGPLERVGLFFYEKTRPLDRVLETGPYQLKMGDPAHDVLATEIAGAISVRFANTVAAQVSILSSAKNATD